MTPQRACCTVIVLALVVAACSGSGGRRTQTTHLANEAPPSSTTSTTSTTSAPSPSTSASSTVTIPGSPDGHSLTIPSSIRHDCSADVATEVQAWIDSAPDNSVLSFLPHGCYRVDETLFVRNRHRLLLDGNGAQLKAVTTGNRTRQELVLSGGSDLTVRNLAVHGANPEAGATHAAYHPDLEAQHAFQVSSATDVLLDHVQASAVYGDFVYIGALTARDPSRNVTVANSQFEGSGRQGISITDAVNVTIEGNTIGGVARSLFDIEPNVPAQEARSIRITGNVTGAAVNFWLADKGAPASIGDIEISDNRMTAATGGLIFVFANRGPYRGPFTIDRNQLIANDRVGDENSTGAFFFTHADNVTIRDNHVSFPKGHNMPAVELRDSHHARVAGNVFTDAGQTVLATEGSSDYHVS